MRTENIKIRILVPFTLAIAFIIAMFIFVTYRHMYSHLDEDWNEAIHKFQESFKTELDLDAQTMNVALDIIIRDESLRKALKNRDRAALLKEAQPLFRHYLAEHNLTHFYFHGPDRINILRVHRPEQYGDRIDRFTALKAEKIAQGKGDGYYAKGVELGFHGMFTNRVVFPWFDGKRLIGYVEMGKELDRVMEKLRKDFGIGLYIFIHKEFLDRGRWEERMRMLGREADWERYPYSVNVSGPIEQVSEETIQTLAGKHLPHGVEKIEVKEKDRYYHFGKVPLVDAGGREVGHMVVFSEYTAEIGAVRSTVMLVSLIFIGVGSALFVFFYIITGRTERVLGESRTNLERQRDELDRLNADLSILYDVSSRASRTIDLPVLLKEVLHTVLGLSALEIESRGGIFLLEGEELKLVTHTGFEDSFLELHKDLKKGGCLCGIAAETGEVVVSRDSYKDERHTIRYEGMTRHGHIILPLKAADRIEGVLCLYMQADMEIGKDRMDMLAALGSQIGTAIGNARQYERIREGEETLKAILNATTDAMFLIDAEGKILTLNETTALRLGKTKDELIGSCIYDHLPPDKARSRRAYVNEAISSGKTVHFEDERNGEWIAHSIYPLFDEQGKITKIAIYGRYITERKLADDKLKKTYQELKTAQLATLNIMEDIEFKKKELEALYLTSRISGSTMDLHKLLDDILQTIIGLDLFGVERKAGVFVMEGDRMKLVSHIGFQDSFIELHKDMKTGDCLCGLAAETGEVVISKDSNKDDRHTISYEGMTSHGHIVVPLKAANKLNGVLCLYVPADIELDQGKINLLEAIGNQTGVAIENARMYERVRESEEKFRTVAESAGDAIIGLKSPDVVYLWNRKAEEIFGYTTAEAIGKNMHDLIVPERYREKALKGLDLFFGTGTGAVIGKAIEIEALRRNGEEFPVELSISAVNMEKEWRAIGIVRDITERRQFQQNLERSNKELQDFAYIVSHDLKAPLRAIGTITSWLAEDYKDKLDDAGREQLDLLLNRTQRMHGMIEGILHYSRAGRVMGEPVQVETQKIVKDVISALSPPANIRITVHDSLPSVFIDPLKIGQVFQNLISNAVKYMDKPEGLIEVGCRDAGDFWEFYVKDNGPGIEERHFERIFQIFQTLKARDEFESTGIGLTIVKKIIEQNNGKIWVESEAGKGSTFKFTLPKKA